MKKKTEFQSINASSSTCDILDNSFPVKICIIVVLSIILICGLAGNVLIATIVYKQKELRKTINLFIVNMAISDFAASLIAVPLYLSQIVSSSHRWHISSALGLIACKLQWYLKDVSFIVSVQSLVWIALDRFIAIVLPMKLRLISSRFRACAIASTWIVALILNSPDFYANELVKINGEIICTNLYSTGFSAKTYTIVRFGVVIAPPLFLNTILYCAIAVTLHRKDNALRSTAVHERDHRKQRAIKMTFSIMAAFYICNLPMPLAILLWDNNIALSCSLYKAIYSISLVLLLLSTAINPIICIAFVQSYRQGFIQLFSCNKARRTNNMTGEQDGITLQRMRTISG